MPYTNLILGVRGSNIVNNFYLPITVAGGGFTANDLRTRFRTSGTIKKIIVHCYDNTRNGDAVLILVKNGSDTSLTTTIPSSTTGTFSYEEDVSVTAGDYLLVKSTQAGSSGTTNISGYSFVFENDDGVTIYAGEEFQTYGNDTIYTCLDTPVRSANIPDLPMRVAGTGKNMGINVRSNGRSTTSTFRSYKNGANGNLAVSVTASTTGYLEDTSNSDSVDIGDKYSIVYVPGSGSNSINATPKLEYVTDSSKYQCFIHESSQRNMNTTNGQVRFTGYGFIQGMPTERFANVLPVGAKATDLYAHITENDSNTGSITVVNGATDTDLAISISSGATGVFSNTSDEAEFDADDLGSYRVVKSSSNTLAFRTISVLLDTDVGGGGGDPEALRVNIGQTGHGVRII